MDACCWWKASDLGAEGSKLGGPFGPERKYLAPLPLIPCKHPPGSSAPHPPTHPGDPPPPPPGIS